MAAELLEDIGTFFDYVGCGRILCMDFGEKTVGLAISDITGLIAIPYAVYSRRSTRKDLGELNDILQREGAVGAVMGLPLQSDGSEGRMCELVRAFANKFVKKSRVCVYLHDERYTTAMASRATQEAGLCRKKSQMIDDKVAAALILQQVLDMERSRLLMRNST